MDKSWIKESRISKEYHTGVESFIEFAFAHAELGGTIKCPCRRCCNVLQVNRTEALDHLVCHGFLPSYTVWYHHGEKLPSGGSTNVAEFVGDPNVGMNDLINAALGVKTDVERIEENSVGMDNVSQNQQSFHKLLGDLQRELYPESKYSKLTFMVKLYHLKCLNKWSDESFTMLLEVLRDGLPMGETLPHSFAETKKLIGELGFKYDNIHACANDCMLFWKDSAHLDKCNVCGTSRWKLTDDGKVTKVPMKVLRHFPLIPRLQRLFMSKKTSSLMRWHCDKRIKDGMLRHPADSAAWKTFDYKNPTFAIDPRNVRLGLASDGLNLFNHKTVSHSTWPVILMPYNLPPWLCMKPAYMFLSLLIPGPKSPGNDIDVFLQPLIDELKQLWDDGVDTYDADTMSTFQMRAGLLWTISDFSMYANLSGWSTKGQFACPICNKDTCSRWLHKSRKFCYMGHRRWLPSTHPFRFSSQMFDGTQEERMAPTHQCGFSIPKQLSYVNYMFGKASKKRKRDNVQRQLFLNWTKKSIFFELPYWEHNLVRHNLDVMHIEQNVCDNIIGTLLGMREKSKDGLRARLDLVDMQIRHDLHPTRSSSDKTLLPPACYTLSSTEKEQFCTFLKRIKVPDGLSCNVARFVNVTERKISGLKSHDYHILMQLLLPLAVRSCLPKKVASFLIKFCEAFRTICCKVVNPEKLIGLERDLTLVLCQLEKIFPPSFFDVMMHLPMHLPWEARVAGPVQYRWMYPIERYMVKLKRHAKNTSHPERSIAEGYLVEECLTFCSQYLEDVETISSRQTHNDGIDGLPSGTNSMVFREVGRHLGCMQQFHLDEIERLQAHRYVLFNSDIVTPFISEHAREIRRKHKKLHARDLYRIQNEQFDTWFRKMVEKKQQSSPHEITKELELLSKGPQQVARHCSRYIVNGFRFHTKAQEQNRKTQSSGMVVKANVERYASARDVNQDIVGGELVYYGILHDIVELVYSEQHKVVLFKGDWVDNNRGVKTDLYGLTSVNLGYLMRVDRSSDEPYVFPTQVEQVFYIKENDDEWYTACKHIPRDYFNMDKDSSNDAGIFYSDMSFNYEMEEDNNDDQWLRQDIEGITIDLQFEMSLQSHADEDVPVPEDVASE